MTPEEQRIAIAEACGWTDIRREHGRTPDEDAYFGKRFIERYGQSSRELPLPDFLADLNAMHEAEKELKLSPLKWGLYCNTLAMLCGGTREDDSGTFVSHKEAIDATAAQRAEAFLRTLNLWKD